MRLKLSTRALTERPVRDPQAATLASNRWSTVGAPMMAEWDAESAIKFAYLANVIVYRCVQIVADTIRMVPIRAGPDPDKPANFNPRSPIARFLGPPPGGPAPGISARKLLGNAIAQYLVTGRFGWEIETSPRSSQIVALWPLVSSHLIPNPSKEGTKYFDSFKYQVPAKTANLRPDQVFYYWRPSLHDWRQPESALQAARLDISVAVMQDRYDYAFLRNDARPAGVVVTERFAEKEDYEAFKEQFIGEHGGPSNAGKLAFIEADPGDEHGVSGTIDFKQIGLSQKDAEFIKRHELKFRNIAMALGVPWSKLDASGRTFDNAKAEDQTFWTSSILPMMLDLQDAMNIELAPRLGNDLCWFDLSTVDALQKEKKHFAPASAPAFVQARLMTVNEARAEVDLPSLGSEGDRLMTPDEIQALRPVASTQRAAEPRSAEPETRPLETEIGAHPAPSPGDGRPAAAQRSNGISSTSWPARAPAPVIDHEVRRTRIWRGFDSQARSLERAWERSFNSLFNRQLVATLKRLEGKRGRHAARDAVVNASQLFDPGYWTQETRDIAAPLYEAVFAAGAARLIADFSRAKKIETRADDVQTAFDVDDPYVQDHIDERSNQLAGNVSDTTYNAVKAEMAEGVSEGEGIPDLSKRIRSVFADASKTRSKRIARTEVISAYNGSASMVATRLGPGVVAGKEWIATKDARTRDEHLEADGQLRRIGEDFQIGDHQLEFPGDPSAGPAQIVNCRCTIILLSPEEMNERSTRFEPRAVEKALTELAIGKFSIEEFQDVLQDS